MHTTNQILDAIAEKHGGASDYRLSKLLGASSPSVVVHWRKGRSSLSLDYALKAAALLGWDSAYVVACVEAERAAKDARLENTDEIRATWEKIAQRFKPAAAILAVFFLLGFAPDQVVRAADGTGSRGLDIHYAYWRRRIAGVLRTIAQFLRFAVASGRFATYG